MNMQNNLIALDNLICPAFTVKDGIIDNINEAAARRGIVTGTEVLSLIQNGADEYTAYTEGVLCLSLQVSGNRYTASVRYLNDQQVFYLESDYEDPELRAFALAAQELRAPLTNALAQAEQIAPNSAKLNKSLYQLLRAVSNMSDAAMYTNPNFANMQLQDAGWLFQEILEKAENFVEKSGRKLAFKLPAKELRCYMDKEKIERAVLNLISNAIKFSPIDDTVDICIECRNNRLYFKIKNQTSHAAPYTAGAFFNRYIREPGIEDPKNGIGLGMSIVRSVALMHNGSLLLEEKNNTVHVTMTIDATIPKNLPLRSPIILPVDYAGGYDHTILEMADILSDSFFHE